MAGRCGDFQVLKMEGLFLKGEVFKWRVVFIKVNVEVSW